MRQLMQWSARLVVFQQNMRLKCSYHDQGSLESPGGSLPGQTHCCWQSRAEDICMSVCCSWSTEGHNIALLRCMLALRDTCGVFLSGTDYLFIFCFYVTEKHNLISKESLFKYSSRCARHPTRAYWWHSSW